MRELEKNSNKSEWIHKDITKQRHLVTEWRSRAKVAEEEEENNNFQNLRNFASRSKKCFNSHLAQFASGFQMDCEWIANGFQWFRINSEWILRGFWVDSEWMASGFRMNSKWILSFWILGTTLGIFMKLSDVFKKKSLIVT